MKEKIESFLNEREIFDVDVSTDLGDNRVGVTRYLEMNVEVNEEGIQIEGVGTYRLTENDIEVTPSGFLTIRRKACVTGDLITIM